MRSLRPDKSGFLEINVTDEMYKIASRREEIFFSQFGERGRLRDSDNQRMTGYLAEAAIKVTFPFLEFSEDLRYDFIYGDLTFEAKATGCNCPPYPDFEAMLYEYQVGKTVDYYIFNRVKNDFSKVWMTGFVSQHDFMYLAKYISAGEKNSNFTYDDPRFVIRYSQMVQPFEFIASLCKEVPILNR